ncbi:MAG: DUF924 domain-containing protein [Gammaproteobacteria bacterium]|nr:DUF924 domain-containing protein [Gammaproteobacteria bacterium]MDH5729719.1 DUF924 domain-containing protein [Gammaproteobacteria bacterium]
MNNKEDYAEVLDFWFAPEVSARWFNATAEFDLDLRNRFETLWDAAKNQQLESWKQSAESCLALAIVLDQFPLNMYRNQAKAFSTEAQAISVSKHAIDQGFHLQLPTQQVAFLVMPLMHSEDLQDQDLSVTTFAQLNLGENLKFAKHHQAIVERFARFPHRNSILGRSSTPEELEYLNSPDGFKG